jgi:hypothetical protein
MKTMTILVAIIAISLWVSDAKAAVLGPDPDISGMVSTDELGHGPISDVLGPEPDPTLRVAPINPPTLPPLDTASCRQAHVCNQFGMCRWQQVCD